MKKQHFSLVEILAAIAIVSMLAGMLLSGLAEAKYRGRYGRWLGYKSNLKAEPELTAYFDFQEGGDGATLANKAFWINQPKYDQAKVNGVISAAQWTWGRWRGKGALAFDGSQSLVTIPDKNTIGNLGPEFSFETWIYPFSTRRDAILFKTQHILPGTATTSNSGGGSGWGQDVKDEIFVVELRSNNRIDFTFIADREWSNPNNSQGVGSGYAWGRTLTKSAKVSQTSSAKIQITPYNWYHIIITYSFEKAALNLYVNGKLIQTNSEGRPVRFFFGETFIGGDSSPGSSFHGLIDELAVYNRELSPAEVKAHHEMGEPR